MWFVAEFRRCCLALLGLLACFMPPRTVAGELGSHGKQSDALFAQRGFLQIEIEIAPEEAAILQNYRRRPSAWERSNVVAVVREGGTIYSNVFLHLKGSAGSFRTFDAKPALTLIFDKQDLEQRFHGLSKISLNNSVQDQSYLCEKIGREMFSAAGIPVPRATHATVELNGRRLGLYVLVEGWTRQFLKRHFDDVRGNLYERSVGNDITDRFDVKSGDAPDDRLMLDILVAATREESANRLETLEHVLDLDRFLTFMAMEVMIGHWDGYCLNRNNYRMFHDRSVDKLIFLPHGMDQLFGLRRAISDGTILPQMRGMVAAAIMQTPTGRQHYLARMSALATNLFQASVVSNRIADLAASLRPAFTNTFFEPEEPRRRRVAVLTDFATGSGPTLANFNAAVALLQNRVAARAASVVEQLAQMSNPVHFGSFGLLDLTGWESQREYGSAVFPKRNVDGDDVLEINVTGTATRALWRTTLFLAQGRYQFHALAKMDQPPRQRILNDGAICLRTSVGSSSLTVTNPPYWIALTNEFVLPSPAHVELMCEFTGKRGRAHFDVSSLKLRQLGRSDANSNATPRE